MSRDYPTWYCPVFACPYSTAYGNNIKKHLVEVHNWPEEDAKEETDIFYEAYRNNVKVVCAKPLEDPTFPRSKALNLWGKLKAGKLEDGGALSNVSSEDSDESERSFVGGGGGGS